ncbi:S24 family peptidase [Sideroxydans sp.]
MQTRKPIDIPVISADMPTGEPTGSNCDGKEIVALMVLGDSMAPEFTEGEILVIQMGAPATEGAYVIAEVEKEDFIFRQLRRDEHGGWRLTALNWLYPDTPLAGLESIKGVVTHKRNARSRKSVKSYVPQAEG